MTAQLHITEDDQGIVEIVIDAPPANALGQAIRTEFESELARIDADTTKRCLVLTGTGKAFCSGDDLREAAGRGADAQASLDQFGRLLNRVETLRVPVIMAVNGYAIGGGLELALCGDIRIASENAFFQGAGVNVGLMASVYRLPRLIGIGPAKAMLLTGDRFSADLALGWGLVTAVHPVDALMDEARKLAKRIATRAPLSVEATKRMTGRAFDLGPKDAARAAGEELNVLASSNDHKAALRAFAKREKPTFERS